MKKFLTCMVLVSLYSCGGSSNKGAITQSAQSELKKEKEAFYVQPQLNFIRSVTVDPSIDYTYEDMTINPEKQKRILGDEAFYINVSSNLYPSFDEIEFKLYASTNLLSVSTFDMDKLIKPLAELVKDDVNLIEKREIKNLATDIVWGKRNYDNKDYDMLNKGYLVKMETTDRKDGVDYKATSTYFMWIDCQGTVKAVGNIGYVCEKMKLKFNYKLIDYSLASSAE